jgi:RimJ/RimL family protein N-acetyltransferase
VTTILETERLRLETWGDEAFSELMELHSSRDVVQFLDVTGKFYDREKAVERLADWANEYHAYGLGKQRLVLKTDGSFVGRAGFSLFEPGTPEIGYTLLPARWGRGYATEIAIGLRDWLAATKLWPGFIGFAHIDNMASKVVLEKIGMRRTHIGVAYDLPMQFYELRF